MSVSIVIIQVDPCDHYNDELRCIEMVGVLPQFAHGKNTNLADNMEHNYQYFMGWTTDGEATFEDGKFMYPGDKPLYPAARILGNEEAKEMIYIYPNAIVAVVVDDVLTKWTRMD